MLEYGGPRGPFIFVDLNQIKSATMKTEQKILKCLEAITESLRRIEEKLEQPGILSGRWLTQQEVCNELKVTRRTLANYRNSGILKFTRLGNKILYQSAELEKPGAAKPEKRERMQPGSRKP